MVPSIIFMMISAPIKISMKTGLDILMLSTDLDILDKGSKVHQII